MAHYMAINKSGKNLPIFSGWPSVDKGNQIGTIYNREVFIYGDTEDGVEVWADCSGLLLCHGCKWK